jgi:hypothetical protein
MSDFNSVSPKHASVVAWSALVVLLLTSVHHAYGAYIYDTPWRLHMVIVGVLAAAAIIGSFLVLRKRSSNVANRIASWVFTVVTIVIPVALIGLFEGGYNHTVKVVLYLAGASPALMHQLFPPPAYELPNDLLFEVTGVLQLVPGIITGYQLYRFADARQRRSDVHVDQARTV